jgi:hypothetical protein
MTDNTVQFGEGLAAPYGEPPDEIKCHANKSQGEYLRRFSWCPGDHTRYDLMYGRRMSEPAGGDEGVDYLLVHLNGMGKASAFIFREPTYLHYSYIMEKTGSNEVTAVGLLRFLERMGHAVGYPKPMALPADEVVIHE